MGLFSSTATDLKTAQTAKADAEAKVAELTAQRAAKLEQDGDPVNEIAKIDSQIGAQQDKIAIYASRIIALEDKQKRQHQAAREEVKRKWLAEIMKRFDRVIAAAEKLDRDMDQVKADYADLIAADREILALPCHEFLPKGKYDDYVITLLKVGELPDLSPTVNAKWVRGGIIHELTLREFDLASRAKEKRRLLLEVLQEAPIPETDVETVEAA